MSTKQRYTLFAVAAILVIAVGAALFPHLKTDANRRDKVVINQAAKTLLYLPSYIADRRGFFQKEGIDATIVTGGGDSQAFAAVVGGSAQFGQGDPVMVPLSLQRG